VSTPATKRNVNWVNVTFTPSGGAAIVLNGVTQIQLPMGGKLLQFKGDNDLYPTTIVPDGAEPKATVTTADMVDVVSLPIGTVGSFACTIRDAKNGIGTGAITYTAALAIVEDTTDAAQHAQFGVSQIVIMGVSPDGQTNPFVRTVAA
jgi:hypothetical protein